MLGPNIYGSFRHIANGTSGVGVFVDTGLQVGMFAVGNSYISLRADFNASYSNTIFTDNGAVHPKSLTLNYIVKT